MRGSARVALWVEHPEQQSREGGWPGRYVVAVYSTNDDNTETRDWRRDAYCGDDVAEAVRVALANATEVQP